MNSRQLRYFQEVLKQQSFSGAARSLHIAQPALSGHVADLEAELGVKLFERTNRGVVATSAGLRLGQHAQTILRQMDIAKSDVSSGGTDPSGEVLVALPLTAAQLLAGPLMHRVQTHFPKIQLHIIEGLSFQSGDVMRSGRGDLGLIPNASEVSNLEAVPLFWENLYLVGRWDGRRDRTGEIDFSNVANYPLVLSGRQVQLRRAIEEAALLNGVHLQKKYDSPGLNSMFSMIEEGLCHTIFNWALIQPHWEYSRLSAWKIVSPEIRRTISIVWPKDRPMTDAVVSVRRVMIELLREVVASGKWPGDPIGLYNDGLL
ncbi:transcriptional regulator, LysR family [Thalassovita litoralis]|jgi:LysR family nitrogen assimilation transcriptional regulator|uniref:Transcriptional regulator, LysR family n=1 Tax=Thalassovita litoralis TaxID=1010611 RepID=A0A521BRT8_9RHOB|nr:LysR substrate-binding domain-containing protein [Thalassovita litoralis]SMO49878.1 transcriptional regulator, LysR family [Thalassovita litoralis]